MTTNWMDELETWAPTIAARRMQGNARAREAFYLLPIPVLVGSYEQIRQDGLDRIPANTFDLVVLDEAQRVKNRNSATALACRLLPRTRSWALSATPLENDADDVASILSFLDPEIRPGESPSRLRARLDAMMLRRRKLEVRAELPPVILQDLRLDLSGIQRKAYDELWEKRAETIREGAEGGDPGAAILGLITRLKMVCNFVEDASSKFEALEVIAEGAGKSGRILVFSQFVRTLQWVSDRLKLPHGLLTGAMTPAERQAAIDEFRHGPVPRALLVSLRAGGVGLNLGEATHVVLFDRWWNPAVENQAIYRAHRFDREEPLHVVRFLATDTIEERISEILEQKELLFDEVVETAGAEARRFTRNELIRILEISNLFPALEA